MCQCPQRASTYFFIQQLLDRRATNATVSMPSTGFYLFLLRTKEMIEATIESVNALNGLLLISSNTKDICPTMTENVSMPSTGFYLFLQHKRNNGTDSQCSVSMPSTGFYLFLQIKKSPGGAERGMCQCPQRASTYFFRSSIHIHYCTEYGVNALNGLLLISSLMLPM